MAQEASKTQIDRLGERLKKGNVSDDDLGFLDQYRRSFAEAYESVVGSIQRELGLEPTGRPAKSVPSILDKLRRESVRLTQIQDIAGCRLIVSDTEEQDRVAEALSRLFERVAIIDRRRQPSYGYRAVHAVVTHLDRLIEIQIRTSLQHLWAELSEKFSDKEGSEIKYGSGNKDTQNFLTLTSAMITVEESSEMLLASLRATYSPEKVATVHTYLSAAKGMLFGLFQGINEIMGESEGESDAVPD